MTAPTARRPIPPAVRPIVEAVHRRYLDACKCNEMMASDDPRNRTGLLTMTECVTLAARGYYPIPAAVIRLGMTPAEHQRQETINALAEQLPQAVIATLETVEV
jgi:hypothetical protein